MHVLIIHQAFASLNEAGGTRHYELARHLVKSGHNVTVITSPVSYLTGKVENGHNGWCEREETGGITILRTYTYTALHRSFFHRVFSFLTFMVSSFMAGLNVRNVDLVWGTSPPIFQGGTAWALARLKRVPFLFEVRDLWPAFAIAVGVLRQPLLIRAAEWFEAFLYRRADRVMVNSPGFVEHVKKRGARQVVLLPNGADLDMFDLSADGADFRQHHGLDGKYVVLYAGAHGLSNDLGVVLEAAAKVSVVPGILIVFLGDGKEKAALAAKAEALALKNVRFLPSVSKQDMPQALAAADACIAILKPLDLYRTTYPNKVFDYMAASRPVILAIDGVIRQVIDDADAGIFVKPGDPAAMADAILRLAADKRLSQALGRNGRRYVEQNFSRLILAGQLVQLLDDMRSAYE